MNHPFGTSLWVGLPVDSADQINFLCEIITELEEKRPGYWSYKLMVLIETPRGYSNVRSIASSSKRLSAIALGQEDFFTEMGM